MKKLFIFIVFFIVIVLGSFWVWKEYKGALPAIRKPKGDITQQIPSASDKNLQEAINNTEFPLKLPKGFVISVLAKNLPGARVIAVDQIGNLWVSQTKEGVVSMITNQTGVSKPPVVRVKDLKNPHGLAFDPSDSGILYIAEEYQIIKVNINTRTVFLPKEKVIDLPKGGRHTTRSLHFGKDGRLFVSIGSTCDVCNEKDERYATIYFMNKDGSDFKKVASGLRNSVFMATNPVDGKLWATEMGRDNLGDDLPPDEINVVESGPSLRSGQSQAPTVPDFGWPICYGKNIHDTKFDPEGTASQSYRASKNQYIRNPCEDKIPSHIDLPAHSALLGLGFVPSTSNWPKEYHNNLIVAFHGSWNRSEPTGYKLVRIKLDYKGNYQGMEDFISGWLASDSKTSLGRPVDVKILSNGIMYVSDDKAGVVYKVEYINPE